MRMWKWSHSKGPWISTGICYEKFHNQTTIPLILQVLDTILIIIYCKRNSQSHTFRYPGPVFLDIFQFFHQQ